MANTLENNIGVSALAVERMHLWGDRGELHLFKEGYESGRRRPVEAAGFSSGSGPSFSRLAQMSEDGRYTLGAFAVVFDSDDRVLVSHRRDLDLWNLPGGRVQVGELPDAAVVREVREETGLDVEVMRLTGVYGRNDGRADIVFTFECAVLGGELVATEEADRHEWFGVDQLPVNTIPKQVARIRDALRREATPVFRTLSEPSGRQWLEMLDRSTTQQHGSESK